MFISVRNPGSETSALKWLILIGMLWAQITYASHQLTHDTEEISEPCRICTGYDHFENALSGAPCKAPIPAPSDILATCFAILEVPELRNVYSARASPQFPGLSL